MKNINLFRTAVYIACSFLGAQAAPILVPNGDFEDVDGPSRGWVENTGDGGEFEYEFLNFDGNPDSNGIITDVTGVGFGLLIANDDEIMSLASLGLTSGQTYRFNQDMQFDLIAEPFQRVQIGGLRVEFFDGDTLYGSTGDIFPELINDGSSWSTYDFDIHIPVFADGIKVILLWGAESAVAFDNIQIEQNALAPITAVPNGDFEAPDGESWDTNDDDGNSAITFPPTGGNGGGFAQIDASTGGFGVLVAFSNQPLPIAGLGLVAGQSYNFQQDMNLFSGPNIGGLKVEFFTGSTQHSATSNIFPATNSGNVWATYDFPIQIPPNVSGIKIIPVFGPDSVVGYDNITIGGVVPTPAFVDIPNGDFSAGNASWITAGEPQTTFTFPATGGNPGGFSLLDNDGGGFGVLVSNEGASIPLGTLGLSASTAYLFSMDSNRDSGSDVAKFKVEFYNRGVFLSDTGDIPASTVTGAWTTDEFRVAIPANTDAIRVVPVAGIGSAIRIDNLSVDPTPVVAPPVPNLDFELGAAGWAAFGQPETTITFPSSGGNPDGFGRMNNNGEGFGVLVANSNNTIQLADLGFTAGSSIDLNVDFKVFSGTDPGAVKIEYFSGAEGGFFSGDETPAGVPDLVNNGADWATYSFTNLFIPETISSGGAVDGIKIVLIAGIGSDVGFDNVVILPPRDNTTITITDCGFDDSGNYFIEVAEGVAGLRVTCSPDLTAIFIPVLGVTNDGANRFTIPAANIDSDGDGADFFRVEASP